MVNLTDEQKSKPINLEGLSTFYDELKKRGLGNTNGNANIWTGTQAEWEALSDSEKDKYDGQLVNFTDDFEEGSGGGMGGHELISSIEDVITNETENKVVDALVTKKYSNVYTERVILTLKADTNTIGTWQNELTEDWVVDDEHFVIIPEFYEADDEELEFNFLFDVNGNTPIYLAGYQWVSQTVKDDKNCGALCIKCGNAPSVDTQIAVDITRVRFDNVVVVNQ